MYFERLKMLRNELKLSQNDLGEILGISQTVYSRYERGALTIPLEILLQLCEIYNVNSDFILGRTNIRNIDDIK